LGYGKGDGFRRLAYARRRDELEEIRVDAVQRGPTSRVNIENVVLSSQ
jgi:hypothetical protein